MQLSLIKMYQCVGIFAGFFQYKLNIIQEINLNLPSTLNTSNEYHMECVPQWACTNDGFQKYRKNYQIKRRLNVLQYK